MLMYLLVVIKDLILFLILNILVVLNLFDLKEIWV